VDRQELQERLIQAGVHPSLYSLDGPASDSESYSLVADGSTWKVLYKERGQFSEIRSGLSESQACLLLYQLLDEALDLGPSSKGSASSPGRRHGA
jgi:hypothetical protein